MHLSVDQRTKFTSRVQTYHLLRLPNLILPHLDSSMRVFCWLGSFFYLAAGLVQANLIEIYFGLEAGFLNLSVTLIVAFFIQKLGCLSLKAMDLV